MKLESLSPFPFLSYLRIKRLNNAYGGIFYPVQQTIIPVRPLRRHFT